MTDLTDTELDALAERLRLPLLGVAQSVWLEIAREAARYFAERERERLEPLRVAVEALEMELTDDRTTKAAEVYATARVIEAARTLFEDTR